ncbi:hypothetical protein F5Y19DRAFT_477406 [Xylariaceae sp. FL1651]|nr:hypothetical protein F5Y19DRAFT_477406 [Xylariaceae sp. FL1651]
MPKKRNPKAKGPPSQHFRRRAGTPSNHNSSSFTLTHGYTLAEEARNTASNRRGYLGRDARLRHQPVIFISAGFMDPLKNLEVSEQATSPTQAEANAPTPDVDQELISNTPSPEVSFNTNGAGLQQSISKDQQPYVQSDPDSDSSEEVILFKGRAASRQQQHRSTQRRIDDGNNSNNAIVLRKTSPELPIVREATGNAIDTEPILPLEGPDFISLSTDRRQSASSRKLHHNTASEDDEAAIMDDYIANMQNEFDGDDGEHPDVGSHGFNVLRDLGGIDSDAVPNCPSSQDDSHDEFDEEIGEEDMEERRQLELEDERLAKIIAKQEELGLDIDDVLLLDGADSDDGWLAAPMSTLHLKKKGNPKKAKMFQRGSQFPSATRMAEAFDELDLMDRQYARLQKSKKGLVSFNLSDSELEEALNVAVKKDRLKKTEKKKAREELRSQGVLGKNVNPDDLRVKYRGGMSLDDLATEVEAFMISSREQLILPPFDKGARKIVHSIANTFKIKSKSAGGGTGRYPVLYRSRATLPFDQDMFEQAFSRVRRTWFPRVDADEKVVQEARVLKRAEARNGKSRIGKSSLVLREGDIVGQHAAEIGAENKGRAMLEKMGWTKGMSLGTTENNGIIVPLMHVIKKTKAGLGDI